MLFHHNILRYPHIKYLFREKNSSHLVRKARMSDNRGTLMSLLSSPPDISDLLVGTRDARASSNCSKEIFYLWK